MKPLTLGVQKGKQENTQACEGVKTRIRMPSKWPIHPQIYHFKKLLCIHTAYHSFCHQSEGGLEVNMRRMIISQHTTFHARLAVKGPNIYLSFQFQRLPLLSTL